MATFSITTEDRQPKATSAKTFLNFLDIVILFSESLERDLMVLCRFAVIIITVYRFQITTRRPRFVQICTIYVELITGAVLRQQGGKEESAGNKRSIWFLPIPGHW
jgi:hypothetical protein